MACYASTVINVALAEDGYLEKASAKNLDSKTANAGYNNYTKYGRDMNKLEPSVMDYPAYWCDAFVDWCFVQAYGVTKAKELLCGGFNDYTPSSAQLYKNKGQWGSVPKLGAQIFFKSTRINHTGIVYKFDNTYVYTVEGNTSSASGVVANGGCVAKKKYARNNSRIAGYGYPKYDAEPSSSSSSTTTVSNSASANVKKGQAWLNDNYGSTLIKYCGAKLEEDGSYGPKSRAGCVCIWKDVVNRKYGSKLTPSNSNFYASCKTAAKKAQIKQGNSGTLPYIAKIILSAKGYYKGSMNAEFDSTLATAVYNYQKASGLSADKVIGPDTWYKLFN